MSWPQLRLRSMRARMTVLFALCTATVITLGDAVVLSHERNLAEERVRETLHVAVQRARAETQEYETRREPGMEHLFQDDDAVLKNGVQLRYEGMSLLEVARLDQAELAAGGLVLFVTDAKGKLLWRSRKINYPLSKRNWRMRGMWYGNQQLIVARSWKPVEAVLQERMFSLAGLGMSLVLLAAMGAWFLVGRTLSPIDALAAQAQTASVKELNVHLQASSPDVEMERLAATLNSLLQRLENEARSRGRFYLAASHELRTPLQALLGSLDVALSRPREAQDYEKALKEAQMQTERLAQLVQDLLQLNALEMRTSLPPATRVNVADSIERILFTLSSLAQQRDVQLAPVLPDIEIEAPPSHLEVLLRNIVENAIKYATPGSKVTIHLFPSGAHACLEVFNPSETATSEIEKWFEPFYRPDASRNSLTGGNGLGLTMAAAVARDHGWPLDLQAKYGGVVATVQWPLPPSQPSSSQPSLNGLAHSAANAMH